MNRSHRYQITVMPLAEEATNSAVAQAPVVFMHENHDELSSIVERCRKTTGLDADAAAAVAIGIKLLSEVMLKQRDNPLFDPLRMPAREFVGKLKSLNTGDAAPDRRRTDR